MAKKSKNKQRKLAAQKRRSQIAKRRTGKVRGGSKSKSASRLKGMPDGTFETQALSQPETQFEYRPLFEGLTREARPLLEVPDSIILRPTTGAPPSLENFPAEASPGFVVGEKMIHAGDRIPPGQDTPLHHVAGLGQTDLVSIVVQAGFDVNHKGTGGFTALHHAAAQNKPLTVLELLNAGAEIDPVADDGETPLYEAARLKFSEIVCMLLERGADPNGGKKKLSVLHAAMSRHNAEEELFDAVRALIEAGADIEFTFADMRPLEVAVAYCSVKMVKILLKAGADVLCYNTYGETILHLAAFCVNPPAVRVLIKAGADCDAPDSQERTPLHKAVEAGVMEPIDTMLKAGANPNYPDEKGLTPLHLATRCAAPDIVRRLLKAGADCNQRSLKGLNPLHIMSAGILGAPFYTATGSLSPSDVSKILPPGETAESIGAFELMRRIEQYSRHESREDQERLAEFEETVQVLVEAGADVNEFHEIAGSPLGAMAALGGDSLIMGLGYGEKEAVNAGSQRHRTALKNIGKSIKAMLDGGADVNCGIDVSPNDTPMYAAVSTGEPQTVATLIEAGADLSMVNSLGENLLHLAVRRGNPEIVRFLVAGGADRNLESSEGYTPITMAEASRQRAVLNELTGKGRPVV